MQVLYTTCLVFGECMLHWCVCSGLNRKASMENGWPFHCPSDIPSPFKRSHLPRQDHSLLRDPSSTRSRLVGLSRQVGAHGKQCKWTFYYLRDGRVHNGAKRIGVYLNVSVLWSSYSLSKAPYLIPRVTAIFVEEIQRKSAVENHSWKINIKYYYERIL